MAKLQKNTLISIRPFVFMQDQKTPDIVKTLFLVLKINYTGILAEL